jgi:hypothetical protein
MNWRVESVRSLFSPHERLRRDLSAYIDGELDAGERARLERHLAGCTACRGELEELRRTVQLLRMVPAVAPPRSFALPLSAAPAATTLRYSPLFFGLRNATAGLAAMLVAVMAVNIVFDPPTAVAPTEGRQEALATSQGPTPAAAVAVASRPDTLAKPGLPAAPALAPTKPAAAAPAPKPAEAPKPAAAAAPAAKPAEPARAPPPPTPTPAPAAAAPAAAAPAKPADAAKPAAPAPAAAAKPAEPTRPAAAPPATAPTPVPGAPAAAARPAAAPPPAPQPTPAPPVARLAEESSAKSAEDAAQGQPAASTFVAPFAAAPGEGAGGGAGSERPTAQGADQFRRDAAADTANQAARMVPAASSSPTPSPIDLAAWALAGAVALAALATLLVWARDRRA